MPSTKHAASVFLRRALCASVCVVTFNAAGPAAADEAGFPTRPVTIVVPFAAGGPTDTLARIVAERMKIALHQPIVVENVSGAGGTIGVGRVARAAPDGYT